VEFDDLSSLRMPIYIIVNNSNNISHMNEFQVAFYWCRPVGTVIALLEIQKSASQSLSIEYVQVVLRKGSIRRIGEHV